MAAPTTAANVPPQNLEAEESVLGALMVSHAAINPVFLEVGLRADDFYREQHRKIFQAIQDLDGASQPVDALTVSEALTQRGELDSAGGRDHVASLAATAPAPGNARHYAEIVQQNALLRRLIGAAQEIQQSVADREAAPRDLAEMAEQKLFQVAHEEHASDFRSIEEILQEEIDKLEALSKGDGGLIGTPSGFKDIDGLTGGFQPGNLIIVAARPSMGKCLSGATLVHDPLSGVRRRLDSVVEAAENGEEIWVTSLGPDLKLRPARISQAVRNGVKETFALKTRLGHRLRATANHPLLTLSGWKQVDELSLGDRVAVPRTLPHVNRSRELPDRELVLLAALIADGNLTNQTPVFCFGPDSPVRDEVESAAHAYGLRFSSGVDIGSARISNGHGSPVNPVTEMLKRHGIWGKKSEEKFVPSGIFETDEGAIARFLSVLFACDGYVHVTERLSHVGYTTISEELARDVQHLLLRLGIVSTIRTLKRKVYEGTERVAREVRITNQESLARFCRTVPVVGKTQGLAMIESRLTASIRATNTDTIPDTVWPVVLAAKGERPWAEVSVATGRPPNHNWHVGKRGLSRPLLGELAVATGDEKLSALSNSDVWWDEIVSIEPAGECETFDIEVPGDHCFVADDMIVHNSTFVCNVAENVAVKHGKPVALFSLEMSEAELAQRFIATQARINGDKLRKGQVAEKDWPAVARASNKLAEAPLWIDDSADLSMLELRAKARRLHSQEKDKGGLAVIIVDYLQLMRAEDPRANRVEQVGQISRGLKILSQELKVPVIGVSQLSRAPEQRPGGKPMLSDLRESGQIEQDADVVMFIWREEVYNKETERLGEADVLIAKHRNGPVGEKTLVFLPRFPKFADKYEEHRADRPLSQSEGAPPMDETDERIAEAAPDPEPDLDDDAGFGVAEDF